jgi:hypothetical protein
MRPLWAAGPLCGPRSGRAWSADAGPVRWKACPRQARQSAAAPRGGLLCTPTAGGEQRQDLIYPYAGRHPPSAPRSPPHTTKGRVIPMTREQRERCASPNLPVCRETPHDKRASHSHDPGTAGTLHISKSPRTPGGTTRQKGEKLFRPVCSNIFRMSRDQRYPDTVYFPAARAGITSTRRPLRRNSARPRSPWSGRW